MKPSNVHSQAYANKLKRIGKSIRYLLIHNRCFERKINAQSRIFNKFNDIPEILKHTLSGEMFLKYYSGLIQKNRFLVLSTEEICKHDQY
jgi:hypothetical protein